MPPSNKPNSEAPSFIAYLEFISDMLGGDLFPLDLSNNDVRSLVSHRAIDYELICSIVKEVRLHNAAFYLSDTLQAYPTLDALGKIRGQLLQSKGDINQISLVDRIGELSVSFFNLSPEAQNAESVTQRGRVYLFGKR